MNISSSITPTFPFDPTSDFFTTTSSSSEIEEHLFTTSWLYLMIFSGAFGIIAISVMGVHAIYHLYKGKLADACTRLVYVVFFIAYLTVCVAYTLFRTDILLPMGTNISCQFGFFLSTQAVFLAKYLLFLIFLLRIHIAFNESALRYPHTFLITVMVTYTVIICGVNGAFIWDAMDLAGAYPSSLTPIVMCTTGNSSDFFIYIVGSMFLFDVIFSIFVCCLFVYKLNKINKMTRDHDKRFSKKNRRESSLRRNKYDMERENKLNKLMRKQTMLVLISVITTLLVLGAGAVYVNLSLLVPLDAIINTFCVWLMFQFSDTIYNKMLHFCCFCCYCCADKDDFLISLHSMSRKLSMHSSTDQEHTVFSSTKSSDKSSKRRDLPTPISERHSSKQLNIEIKFDNNLKSTDLNTRKNKKKKIVTTTTTTTITETTTKTVIEKEEIDSGSENGNYDTINAPHTPITPTTPMSTNTINFLEKEIELIDAAK